MSHKVHYEGQVAFADGAWTLVVKITTGEDSWKSKPTKLAAADHDAAMIEADVKVREYMAILEPKP